MFFNHRFQKKNSESVTFQRLLDFSIKEFPIEEVNRVKQNIRMNEHEIPIEKLVENLYTDLEKGLSLVHAARILKKNGKNKFYLDDGFSYFDLIKDFFGGFSIFLWIGAFVFIFAYIITYILENKYLSEYLWLGIFLAGFNVIKSFFSFHQSEKTNEIVESFKRLIVQSTIVTREGQKYKIPSEKLVVGDLIDLKEGDVVPADIRIVKSFNLKIDSFHLPNNTKPEFKSAFQTSNDPFVSKNISFLGDHIFEGTGKGIVLRTGKKTLYSQIAYLKLGQKSKNRNLLRSLKKFIKITKIFAITIGITYFLKSYLYGYSLLQSTKFAIGLIIAQVPECLIITVNIVLGLATKKLEKKNCLIKNIETIEKLGSISIVCSDKSGTLTQNKMQVKHIWYNNTFKNLDDFELCSDISLRQIIDIHPILYDALVCNSVTFLQTKKRPSVKKHCVGDPMDIAILQYIEDLFGNLIDYQALHPKVYEIPFNSTNKFHLSIHETSDGYRIVMKGAPELIIQRCSSIFINDKYIEMTEYWVQRCNKYLTEMTKKGQCVIGYCDFILDRFEFPKNYEFLINELGVPNFPIKNTMRFLGLISMFDPLRPNTREAVKKCKTAGIRVIMITGDHPITAESIANQVGIISKHNKTQHFGSHHKDSTSKKKTKFCNAAVIDGPYLKNLTNAELDSILRQYDEIVFARTSPIQKEKVVAGYQRLGEFVAVTGDGVNDCPCLRKADIGIAMGITGTDVSKEAADLILLDDNFATIQNAIEEGRLINDNLKKSITYTLTTKVAELSPFLVYIIWDIPLPIGTIGILLIDIVTEIIPPISLAFEKSELDLMTRPPIDKNDQLVNFGMKSIAYGQIGMVQATAAYLMYTEIMTSNGFFPSRLIGIRKSWDSDAVNDLQDSYGQEWTYEQRKDLEFRCNTGFFFAILMVQLADLIICRTRVISLFKQGFKRNFMLNIALGLEILMALVFLYTPGLNNSIHLHPLILYRWVLVPLPFVIFIFIYDELRKYMIRKFPNSWFKKELSW